MTAARLQTIRNFIGYVPTVFAAGGLRSNPSDNSDGSTAINWASGIPPSYAEMEQDGGKRALLADINCIGSLASRERYLWQHGGYHTFDMRVANLIGGYGFGAVLDWWNNATGLLRKVRCIKEDGNCFTPIDDPDHGVESSDPHWQIVDMIGQSTFKMENVAETEIIDPDFNYIYRGTNALYLQVSQSPTGNTYFTNKWTAPDDVKIVADSIFHDSTGIVRTSSQVYRDIPNPFFYGTGTWSSENLPENYQNLAGKNYAITGAVVSLIVTPPGGSSPITIKMMAQSSIGTYAGNGNSLGPIYLPKGTTMQVAIPISSDANLVSSLGISFNFKFRVFKV